MSYHSDLSHGALQLLNDSGINPEIFNYQTISLVQCEQQGQAIALVNRAAQEKRILNNRSYDRVITTTVQLAGAACDAYQRGSIQLGSSLIDLGHATIDYTWALAKGTACGVGNSILKHGYLLGHALIHPAETLYSLNSAVVKVAKSLKDNASLTPFGSLLPRDEALAKAQMEALAQEVITNVENFVRSIDEVKQHVKNTPSIELTEQIGRVFGQVAADVVILKNINIAVDIAATAAVNESRAILQKVMQKLASFGEFTKTEIAALAKAEEMVVSAGEGLSFSVNPKKPNFTKKIGAQAAREGQTLHAEMNTWDKAKNAVKSGSSFSGTSIQESEAKMIEELKRNADKVGRSNRFGKIYRDPDTQLWWSKDNAGHGGSKYKVFKEEARGFEWQFDADALGKEIVGKHKGPTGLLIPYKEVTF